MYDYEHTQPGTLMRIMLIAAALIWAGIGITMWATGKTTGAFITSLIVLPILAFVLALFHALTVRVSVNAIQLAFGIGLVQKNFPLENVESVASVRNSWVSGWGIRMISGGWLYNVSGFEAVELKLKNGRRARIGTDEPAELEKALNDAIGRLSE